MALSPGTKLGPYEVLAPLGAGGMGEVYRASDAKLKREVALKVLPEAVSKDPERMARFQREAQVLASLNHPGIASIYGLEESRGTRALVMELVDGPTLADRIVQGPIPLEEALPLAKQIAEALEFAHEKGIIHRDLKPANIKIRPDGTVKVLDFGLAKALSEDSTSSDSANSPTLSMAATKAGIILGTAGYMSPEQARGKAADRRADIWSFGAVLYEMLSGQRAFHGETVSDTLAAVIRAEPDWAALPTNTPPAVRNLLRRCLEKDSKLRLQAIGEARIALESPLEGQPGDDVAPVAAGAKSKNRLAIAGAAGLLALGVGLALGYLARPDRARQTIRSAILPPQKFGFAEIGVAAGSLALSPDGTQLAYSVIGDDGKQLLYVRSLTAVSGQPLAGTEDAIFPFWSPDGKAIGFFAEGRLKKIDAAGGPVTVLCSAPEGRGGIWSREGVIIFAATVSSGLSRVSATGGAPVALTTLDTSRHENSHRWPQFLPDGRHYLYLVRAITLSESGVYVGALDSPERVRVLDSASNAFYSPPGFLLYLRGNALVAQPFDAKSLRLSGDTLPVADQVALNGIVQRSEFSVSENGLLVYSQRANSGNSQLIWVDRAGKQLGALGVSYPYGSPSLSPDGQKLAVSISDEGNAANSDLWIINLVSEAKTRLTFNSNTSTFNIRPLWSPDGAQIVFTSNRSGHYQAYLRTASGLGNDRLLWPSEDQQYPMSWSPDGRFILLMRYSVQANLAAQFWILPTFGDRKPFPFSPGSPGLGIFSYARISPNGKWVVYESTESGRPEIYVSSFPSGAGKWQVSANGGNEPIWRADGGELYFLGLDQKMMAAGITEEKDGVAIGTVQPLFQTHVVGSAELGYDVTRDGKKFLLNSLSSMAGSEPLTLVVNWDAELKKK